KEGLVDKCEGRVLIRLLQSSVILLGKHPGSDPSSPPQGESHLEKPGSNLSTAVNPRHSFMAHLDEAETLHQSAEPTPEVGIHSSARSQRVARYTYLVGEAAGERMAGNGRSRRAVVRLLEAEPTPRAHSLRHTL